ncbi:MAG: ParB/RepB/Spo0J family partition protein [Chitinophagales bacterium]|nr:ParB/RepB/Spo0J family partition protein [Chitinophagales bacterium]
MSKSRNNEALGKGIRALLNTIDDEAVKSVKGKTQYEQMGSVVKIPLQQIEVNPFQPRVEFNEEALQDLAESIKVHGVVQPITVRKLDDKKFQLIAGERRLRASKLAGLNDIPAYVRTANDQESLEIALIENIQREDLNALEIALNYQRLLDECNLTHEDLSQRLGKSRTAVTNYLRLLKLPPDIQSGLKSKAISMGHARALAGVDDVVMQLYIFKEIVGKELSVRQTESMIKDASSKPKSKAASTSKKLPFAYQKLQDQIAGALSTKVNLKPKSNGSGEINIYFHNEDDLERILAIINND